MRHTGNKVVAAVPLRKPAIISSSTSRASASGSSPGDKSTAAADDGGAGERAPDQMHRDFGVGVGGEDAGIDTALDAFAGEGEHLMDEGEAGPLLGDLRHRPVDEHQLEELAILLGELVVGPPARAKRVERIGRGPARCGPSRRAGESLLRRARRRCRPCWGNSCRSRRGCTRSARRSCGSTRCGSRRRRRGRARRPGWTGGRPGVRGPDVL